MCGITGIVSLSRKDVFQSEALLAMTSHMTHRGPDDEGFLLIDQYGNTKTYKGDDTPAVSPSEYIEVSGYPAKHIKTSFNTSSMVALGHRRLSILDLSPHGHQPMCTPDQRYWIVYNGEIYNFQKIAQELKEEGVIMHGQSDTEVIINAYAVWGESCLEKFNGMFAFAIWDNTEKSLFCARDRIGIKPFYYTIQNGQFIFASDIKTLIASKLFSPSPDIEGLYMSMAFGMSPRPKTAFKGIKALEQSHWMLIHLDGRIAKQRYWQIPIGTQNFSMSAEDAAELLEEQLTASIKYRLVADVPVGTFMSGGIDSTLISAIASKLHPGIKAFTLAFENTAPELDEVMQAEATAQMHSMDHIVHEVDPLDSIEDLDFWLHGYEEPFYSIPPNYIISKLVKRNNVTVILNGLGGDELFAGYNWYGYISKWKLLKSIRPLLVVIPSYFCKNRRLIKDVSHIKSADRLHTLFFSKFTDNELHQLFNDSSLGEINTIENLHRLYCNGLEFTDEIEAMSYMDLMNYIGNHHVHRTDQFTMACSLEGRFPFLDHKLVEAAFTIPSCYKIRGKVHKYVLREVAKKYIAPECLSMKKKGFGLPLKQWMQGPINSLVLHNLSRLKERAIITSETVDKFFTEYQNGRRSSTQIWHLVALEKWFQQFID